MLSLHGATAWKVTPLHKLAFRSFLHFHHKFLLYSSIDKCYLTGGIYRSIGRYIIWTRFRKLELGRGSKWDFKVVSLLD